MKKSLIGIITVAAMSLFASHAYAAGECEAKAVGKDGKPLAGAAKSSSVKKCMADAKK